MADIACEQDFVKSDRKYFTVINIDEAQGIPSV